MNLGRMAGLWKLISFCVVLALVGCRQEEDASAKSQSQEGGAKRPLVSPPERDLFRDVTKEWGVDFEHQSGEPESLYFMPRSMGSGAALLDYDGDGLLDLYLIQNAGPDSGVINRLYRQAGPGKMEDVSDGSGLDVAGYGMGVACGDVNNDGRMDLLLTEYGATRLFINQSTDARPQFADMTATSGIENQLWGTSACMIDYNRDGWLDLVLVNYVNYDPSRWCADGSSRQEFCGPDNFAGRITKLYRNQGAELASDGVRFEDVTIASGLGSQPGPGLGVFCADFDGDHWADILVANDGHPNHLWMNQKDGTFKEEATSRGLAYNSMGRTEANMGIAVGDVDTDGLFDILVTHLAEESHTLWSQGPVGLFVDKTAASGVTASKWRGTGFGTALADLENDGDLDLVIVNGRVTRGSGQLPKMAPALAQFWWPYAQRDQILLNNGSGRFVDASEANAAACGLAAVSRGLAVGDLNRDGALDLVVTRIAGPPAILLNQAGERGHWLRVRAQDPSLKRDVYGAEIYLHAGARRWMRWINPGYSYLCSNEPVAHFGLGDVSAVDRVEVRWPDGTLESFESMEVDQEITLRRGEGKQVNHE